MGNPARALPFHFWPDYKRSKFFIFPVHKMAYLDSVFQFLEDFLGVRHFGQIFVFALLLLLFATSNLVLQMINLGLKSLSTE